LRDLPGVRRGYAPALEETAMHFIEQIFHIAPDEGTGLVESAIALVFVMFPLAVLELRMKRRRDS
jgi:hypothetical protein